MAGALGKEMMRRHGSAAAWALVTGCRPYCHPLAPRRGVCMRYVACSEARANTAWALARLAWQAPLLEEARCGSEL